MTTPEQNRAVTLQLGAIPAAAITIDTLVGTGNRFKIGKSGDDYATTRDRYVPDEFANWEVVYESTDCALIDELEEALIRRFKARYTVDCENEQEGGGPSGNCTYVYLAYD